MTKDNPMTENERIISDFIQAWSRLDADELAGYFHEHGTYHNIPIDPVSGRDEIRDFIKSFIQTWSETTWTILTLASVDNLVITERLDCTLMTNGKALNLPCVGIFEMDKGKIKVWRDYFDLGTYLKVFD